MAHVSGPCSTLPGDSSDLPPGSMCDQHPDAPAVRRVQGETDSFGAEYHDCCQVCLDGLKTWREQERIGRCEWCKNEAKDLRPRRDYEEGMSGRVYQVCGACVSRENKRLADELDRYDDDF
jgi:hypothetical protein